MRQIAMTWSSVFPRHFPTQKDVPFGSVVGWKLFNIPWSSAYFRLALRIFDGWFEGWSRRLGLRIITSMCFGSLPSSTCISRRCLRHLLFIMKCSGYVLWQWCSMGIWRQGGGQEDRYLVSRYVMSKGFVMFAGGISFAFPQLSSQLAFPVCLLINQYPPGLLVLASMMFWIYNRKTA